MVGCKLGKEIEKDIFTCLVLSFLSRAWDKGKLNFVIDLPHRGVSVARGLKHLRFDGFLEKQDQGSPDQGSPDH